MKKIKPFYVIKEDGERELFSPEKFHASLIRSGLSEDAIDSIIDKIKPLLRDNLTTRELYQMTYSLIKEEDRICASRYSLKEGLRLLGPSGFPFEHLVGQIFQHQGYSVEVGVFVSGKCVGHEIDVLAQKDGKYTLVECKFHNLPGSRSSVQTPLYVKARFHDISDYSESSRVNRNSMQACGIFTNTKFTSAAIQYGLCAGLQMVSWNFPHNNGIEYLVDKYGLYPVTVLADLHEQERKLLLDKNIVLCQQIEDNPDMLANTGIEEGRKKLIIGECKILCKR